MVLDSKNILTLSVMGLLLVSLVPVNAEVQTVNTDKKSYAKGDKISFSGTVSEDSSGLVTVVIRDSNDKFVMLTQAIIQPDNTYQREIETNEKFSVSGIYNVTSFITNMTAGSMTTFDYSIYASPTPNQATNVVEKIEPQKEVQPAKEPQTIIEPKEVSKIANFVDPNKDPQYYVDRYNSELSYKEWFDRNYPDRTIEEAVGISKKSISEPVENQKIPGFPDPEIDPQYYVDRYNNEDTYREWFDRNFPSQTIYEVVGAVEPESQVEINMGGENDETEPISITQEASAMVVESSTVTPTPADNSELSQMLLALGGLGVLFGAVYGVKRKVDNNTTQINKNKTLLQKKVETNSEQISQNRFWLKKKIMSLKPTEEPVSLIKERLAKGEITVDEYYKLLRALRKK